MNDLTIPCIKILGISSTDEKVCAGAGRISTGKGSALQIFEKSQDREKNASLIQKVTASGHTSTLEHCYINLAFSNVSVVVEQFMIEFRLASFTVQSRRYVDFAGTGYHIPAFKSNENREKYIKHMDYLFSEYEYFTKNGMPKEDARFILPYCFRSNFFCSLNAREMINVLKSMIYGRGSKYDEIRLLGLKLLSDLRELLPGILTDFEKRNELVKDLPDFSFINENAVEGKKDKAILISYTKEPEKVIAKAALIEHTSCPLEQIDGIINDKAAISKIIDEILSTSRPRSLENAMFTFRLTGVSLACLTHFTRHRVHSIQIPDLNTCDRTSYVIPKLAQENPELLKRYKLCFKKTSELYDYMKATNENANNLIYILLAGNTIDIVSGMNARELLLFFKLRSCNRAQWEIQSYANEMLRILREKFPDLFSHYGPSCYVTGKCPEGRFSCGRINQIREIYG